MVTVVFGPCAVACEHLVPVVQREIGRLRSLEFHLPLVFERDLLLRGQQLFAPQGAALQVVRGTRAVELEFVKTLRHPPPPSCSTEKSWLHFRPPPVDFCGSRLAIGAATERARAPASARQRGPKPQQTRVNSSGVAPASPRAAYRALLERCIGRPPKKVGRIFGPRRGLRLPAWPRLVWTAVFRVVRAVSAFCFRRFMLFTIRWFHSARPTGE